MIFRTFKGRWVQATERGVGDVLRWWLGGVRLLGSDLKRRWVVFAALAVVWGLALVRLFVHPTPLVPLLFNWTASLPYCVAWLDYGSRTIGPGDFIVYRFSGEAALKDYPGLKGQPFFKRIAGVPGDLVSVRGRDVFVNGTFVGRAKPVTFDRRPLDPIASTVIPPGKVYVQGSGPDSFDSRYRSSGLVDLHDVVARVRPLL